LPTKASIRQTKYDKDHTVRYNLKLNTETDKDIIETIETIALDLKTSKQGAIKYIVRVYSDLVTVPITVPKNKNALK
jgi:hypothetical protein